MRLLRKVMACYNIGMGIARACSDPKMKRISERVLKLSLQPRPLDKPRGENASKLSRCNAKT